MKRRIYIESPLCCLCRLSSELQMVANGNDGQEVVTTSIVRHIDVIDMDTFNFASSS